MGELKRYQTHKHFFTADDMIIQTEAELAQTLGEDLDINIKVNEVAPKKKEFVLSASIHGLSEPIYLAHRGRSIKDSLLSLKKSVIKKVRSFSSRKLCLKRRNRKFSYYKNHLNY